MRKKQLKNIKVLNSFSFHFHKKKSYKITILPQALRSCAGSANAQPASPTSQVNITLTVDKHT